MNYEEETIGQEEAASSPLEYILSENECSRNPFRFPTSPSGAQRRGSRGSYRTQSSSSPEILRHRASNKSKEKQLLGNDGRDQIQKVVSTTVHMAYKKETWTQISEDGSSDSSKTGSREATDQESEDFTLMDTEHKFKSSGTMKMDGRGIITQEMTDGIDGLVLMNSTRLRPAAKTTEKDENYIQLYMHTFRSLFLRHDNVSAVISLAMHGNLKKNPFRSICWRMLLNVFPSSSMDWVPSLQSYRSNFTHLQEKHLKDDRFNDRSLDLTINNPLSQADESPWNQHFQDSELRRVIEQDVNRTSPEIDFFQSEGIRSSLSNILFVYAKAHPDLSYKQGMHELLAPLYYVVNSDIQAFLNASALAKEKLDSHLEFQRLIHEDIFDPNFLEADVYTLFESLMDCVSDWYKAGNQTRAPSFNKNMGNSEPWSRPRDEPKGNMIVERLSHIQDSLLKRHDKDLYTRLEKLEIYPQLYGIRWLRLLFGREFHFVDTLTLWDAIFADSCPPGLVDQITVALLMSVRDLLLVYDFTDCVSLLMKLPSNINVSYVVAFALHLKDPLRYPRPSGSAFDSGTRRTISEPSTAVSSKRGSMKKSSMVQKKPGPRRRKTSEKSGMKRELKELDRTYAFQNPRDLPDFTVVDMNDLKGRAESYDACDTEDLGESASRRQSNNQGNVANSLYGRKIQMLKKLDSLRDLLRNEDLVHKAKITSTLNELQEICDNLETTELLPMPMAGSLGDKVTGTAPQTLMRHASVASDVASMIK